jgi:hypothetical protein
MEIKYSGFRSDAGGGRINHSGWNRAGVPPACVPPSKDTADGIARHLRALAFHQERSTKELTAVFNVVD